MSAIARIAGLLASRAPRWPHEVAVRRGQALGRLLRRLDRRHRRVAEANLAFAFPGQAPSWHRDTAIQAYEQLGRTAMEMLWSPQLAATAIDRIAIDDGVERVREATRAGAGALIASAHFGNWELIALALARLDIPLVSIARPLDDPDLNRLLLGLRTQTGAGILPKQNAVRGALRALREGKVVAVLNDQNTLRREAVFVPFFGRLAATSPLLAHLHLRSGAPVFPGFAVPDGSRYRIRFEPALPPVTDTPREQAVVQMTAAITSAIENQIRQQPGAWLWMHDRWRERPVAEGGAGPSVEDRAGAEPGNRAEG